MKNNWYEIIAKAGQAEVFLYDEIGGWGISAKQFINEIRTLDGTPITLRIHSPGGGVLDGHAIFNALKRHDGGVTVAIDGLAASMASVIAMAGDTVSMAENGFVMIHNPHGVALGESEDMRKSADLLDKMRDGLVNIYADKTGKPKKQIEKWMDEETWFSAEEAMAEGFVDSITEEIPIAAKFDLAKFKFIKPPQALIDNPKKIMSKTVLEIPIDELTNLRAQAAALTDVSAQLALISAERDVFKSEVAKLNVTIADKDKAFAALADQNKALEAEVAKLPEKVNAEAQRLIAAGGHPQPIATTPTTSQAPKNHAAAMEAMTPGERSVYFSKHKKEIFAERNALHAAGVRAAALQAKADLAVA